MPYQIFVSYSSKDKNIADAVCAHLEANKLGCWIAPRDIMPGTEYGEAIVNAIRSCKILVVILTKQSNSSRHVRKEVERAVSSGLVVIPFRVEDVTPSDAMEYFLSAEHWLDAFTPPLEKHIQKLAATANTMLCGNHEIPRETMHPPDHNDANTFEEVAPDNWGVSNGFFSRVLKIFHDK